MLIEFVSYFKKQDGPDFGKMSLVYPFEELEPLPLFLDITKIETINPSTYKNVCTIWTDGGHSWLIKGELTSLAKQINNAKKVAQCLTTQITLS